MLNPPALIYAVVLSAYWLTVCVMVIVMRRRTGRAANVSPPERTGRLLRLVWAPLIALWTGLPWLAATGHDGSLLLRPLFESAAAAWVSVVVGVAAFTLTVVCWRNMGTAWRMGIDPNEKNRLVFGGPFALVRHPIYALSTVLCWGTAAVIPSPAMLIVAVGHTLLLQWEARREEDHMTAQHGEAYAAYARRVGRFVPRSLRPFRPGAAP